MNDVVLNAEALHKTYNEGPIAVEVLKGIDLKLSAGEKIAVVGASGSGKSTLLHLLGGLDVPTSGIVEVQGKNMSGLSGKARGELRNRHIGVVYQFHHLLPEFSALENVAMPSLIAGEDVDAATEKSRSLLARVGLEHRLLHKPGELSGGERQRTAIARALINQPALLLADEPTGNLDTQTAEEIWRLIERLNQETGTAMVVVTHALDLAERMDRILELQDGKLVRP